MECGRGWWDSLVAPSCKRQTAMPAGWVTTFIVLACPARQASRGRQPPGSAGVGNVACNPGADAPGSPSAYNHRVPRGVWGAMAVYFLCFGAMNWLLYESLL